MTPDDRGPDLVAYHLGELTDDERQALEAELQASPELRAELARLASVLDLAPDSTTEEASEDGLAALLAAVEEESRAGEMLTALALGQLEGDERTAAEALASGSRWAVEYRAIEQLVADARSESGLEPSAGALARLRSAMAADEPEIAAPDDDEPSLADVPAPVRGPRRPARLLHFLLPLAAAAAVFVALSVDDHNDALTARVTEGGVLVTSKDAAAGSEDWVKAGNGGVDFRVGRLVHAADGPATLRVLCFGTTVEAPATPPAAGSFDLELAAGSRIERTAPSRFVLHEGAITVNAGSFEQTKLEFAHGEAILRVVGTRFHAAAVDGRLSVLVLSGQVELIRAGERVTVSAGEQAHATETGVRKQAANGQDPKASFLTPRVALAAEAMGRSDALLLRTTLTAGDGGPVEIVPFDDYLPLFVVRLKGPGGRTKEVKLLATMLSKPPPVLDPTRRGAERHTFRLAEDRPYSLEFSVPGLELEPGTWHGVLRYTSYKPHPGGAVWLGVVESETVPFEVIDSR